MVGDKESRAENVEFEHQSTKSCASEFERTQQHKRRAPRCNANKVPLRPQRRPFMMTTTTTTLRLANHQNMWTTTTRQRTRTSAMQL